MKLRASATVLAAAALFGAALPGPVEAGIVVLKNGEVFVGRVRKEEVSEENIVVRWPYKSEVDPDPNKRGFINIPRFRVRWYDIEGDEPSDAYWEEYENEKIDQRFLPHLERWRLRKKTAEQYVDVPVLIEAEGPRSKLSPIPVPGRDFELKKPDGWTTRTDGDITIIESNLVGADDYRPQIHVYAVEAVTSAATDQLPWIEAELKAMASEGFEVKEMNRLLPVKGGFDQEMLTASQRAGRTIYAKRRISFRNKKTYFFSAFAHQKDYDDYGILFEQCMASLVIKEDLKGGEGAAAPGGATPPGGSPQPPAPGQGAPPGG